MSDPLRELIVQWRDAEAWERKHLAFNEAHGNCHPEDSANVFKQCADELETVLSGFTEARSRPSGWICSCGSRSMRQDGGPHCENCGAVVTYRGPWVAPGLRSTTLDTYHRALMSIANSSCCSGCQEAARVAQKALEDCL